MFSLLRNGLLCGVLGCFTFFLAAKSSAEETSSKPVDYKRDIAPVLSRCTGCHSAEVKESGLNLQLKADAFKGGDNGRVIVPGKSEESQLFKLAHGDDKDRKMPPPGESQPLTPEQLATLKRWIDEGAVWPDSADGSGRDHWAYKQPVKHVPPTPKNSTWVKTPIDAFVFSAIREGRPRSRRRTRSSALVATRDVRSNRLAADA
ncbi:MAG: hypothetical protein QM811_29630 [Pirellulales bacterium]